MNRWRETCQVRRDLRPCSTQSNDGSRNSPGTVRDMSFTNPMRVHCRSRELWEPRAGSIELRVYPLPPLEISVRWVCPQYGFKLDRQWRPST